LSSYLAANYPSLNLEAILSAIINPLEYPGENFNEHMSLLNIAIKIKKQKVILNSLESLPQNIRADLHQHVKEYSSIPFGYRNGIVWDKKYFFNKLQEIAKISPAKVKRGQLAAIEKQIKERDKITANLKLPDDILNLVLALRKLAFLQELKKTAQTRSHPILQLVVKAEIAKRVGLDINNLDYLGEDEIEAILRAGKVSHAFKKELRSRETLSVNIMENEKSYWLLGRDAKNFLKINNLIPQVAGIKEVRGVIARHGKVKGIVKVCRSAREISKVNAGDILVTAMTTPDFVPAIRLAAGIVTDEGGITCHAAIMARELGKPCIISTKIATKIFKDDQMVEVDAQHGVVRFINDNIKI
jgi:phosphohistidine swiveling domain-containing protein